MHASLFSESEVPSIKPFVGSFGLKKDDFCSIFFDFESFHENPDQPGPTLVRSGIPDQNPDQFSGPFWSGPEFRTTGPDQILMVRISGPTDRTKDCWSGFPDQRTGPKIAGPDFRTNGPDQIKAVRISGPPDRTKNKIGPEFRTNPDRPGPTKFWSGPGIHAVQRTLI